MFYPEEPPKSVTSKHTRQNKETFNPNNDIKDLANPAKNNQQSLKLNTHVF